MNLRESQTAENLLRAFVGESQAIIRYTFAASAAKSAGLHWVERVFRLTADQEKEHAELFLDELAPFAGAELPLQGSYPIVDTKWTMDKLLRAAQQGEYDEADEIYPAFARTAMDEGFAPIAALFQKIAKIERTHGDRFAQLAQRAEQGMLFGSNAQTAWMCLNCGHVHFGTEAPAICPVCQHVQGYFVRVEAEEILARL